jgi:L-ascorbate metabolism protein UlaG (beta-lactamase superfamily)
MPGSADMATRIKISAPAWKNKEGLMKYQHLRHATGILLYGGLEFLVDPMLAPRESCPPIRNSWNSLRNPRVDLPLDLTSLDFPRYCLVTHLHLDHFDEVAKNRLPKDIHLICQPGDADRFEKMGFSRIMPVDGEMTIESVTVSRVPGQHGIGRVAELMGVSSGYVFSAASEPTLYITGDTVFFEDMESTLDRYKPGVIIAFGGAAQFSEGDPITLTPGDILEIHHRAPGAKIICVHMDSINHCRTTREDLERFLSLNLPDSRSRDAFFIPFDGETLELK